MLTGEYCDSLIQYYLNQSNGSECDDEAMTPPRELEKFPFIVRTWH